MIMSWCQIWVRMDGVLLFVFSVLFYSVNANYLNYDYKSPFHDNGMYDHDVLCAARGMSFFKDMLHSVRLSGMATTLIYTLISHSLQITIHNVFILSACDMMMA
jgi:hypothetical protein